MQHLFNRIEKFRNENVFYYYIVSLFSVYTIWKLYKKLVYSNIQLLSNLGTEVNYFFSKLYISTITLFLDLFSVGYRSFETTSSYGVFPGIALEGPQVGGIYIAYHCLGLAAFFVFCSTLLLLPGSFKTKTLFAFVGVFVMYTVNTIRIFSVLVLDKFASKQVVEINHSSIFVVLVYLTLFILHFIYIRRFLQNND